MQPQQIQQSNVSSQVKQQQPQSLQNKQITFPKSQQQQQLLLDFSSMFKKNGTVSSRPALIQTQNISQPNWLLEIPAKLQITIKDLQQRRYMNMERWNHIVKENQGNEGMTAVVTVGKWLENWVEREIVNRNIENNNVQWYQRKINKFTIKKLKQLANKNGLLQQLSNKTRRQSILQLFDLILSQNNLKQQYQPPIIHQLSQYSSNNLLTHLLTHSKSQNKCFLYICHGFILYLLGYENTPLVPLDAYKKLNQINPQKLQMWLIFGTLNKQLPPLMIKRWSDIEIQLKTRFPQYLNLDQTKKGKQTVENVESATVKDKEVSCIVEITRKK